MEEEFTFTLCDHATLFNTERMFSVNKVAPLSFKFKLRVIIPASVIFQTWWTYAIKNYMTLKYWKPYIILNMLAKRNQQKKDTEIYG